MKKGLPPRARVDGRREAREARVAAEQVGEQLRDRPPARAGRAGSAGSRTACIHAARYSGRKFRIRRPRAAGQRIHPLREEGLARGVDPVQVLDQRHEVLRARTGRRRPGRSCAARRTARAGFASGSICGAGRSGSGTPKNSNMTGSTSRKPSSRSSRRPAMRSRDGAVVVALVDAEVGTEDLQDRQEREVLAVRHGAALEHGEPVRAAALGELEAEAALAGARLGDDADHLAVAGLRLRERRLERAQVRVAADEAGEAARARDVEARARRAEPAQLEHGHRARRRPSRRRRRGRRARSSPRRARRWRRSGSRCPARRAPPCAARARRCDPARCSPCAGRRRSCRRRPRRSGGPCASRSRGRGCASPRARSARARRAARARRSRRAARGPRARSARRRAP